ncbi:MAG: hypothetical protein ACRDTM_13985, partial [Micromonosporaceae bacterium]
MKWLFLQTWFYCLISFLLGALLMWLFTKREKTKEYTTEEGAVGDAGAGGTANLAAAGAVGAGVG